MIFGERKKNHLEIPVDDTVLVAVIDALQDLLNTMRCVRLAVELARNNILKQFTTCYAISIQNTKK